MRICNCLSFPEKCHSKPLLCLLGRCSACSSVQYKAAMYRFPCLHILTHIITMSKERNLKLFLKNTQVWLHMHGHHIFKNLSSIHKCNYCETQKS